MRKLMNFAYTSAIALLSAGFFVACSSSDDAIVENNPTYDPVENTVTAQFVLNITSDTQKSASNRAAATTVQAGGANFRGIDNTVLFAYKTASDKHFVNSTLAGAAAAARYDLGTILAKDAVDNTGEKSNRILELTIPVETDAMMFYGKAIKGTLVDNENGKITYNIPESNVATAFSFGLNQRIALTEVNSYNHEAALLAALLTDIITVSSTYTVNAGKYPDWTGASSISSTWKDMNPTTLDRTLSPLEEKLYTAFQKLTGFTDEFRAGSVKAIVATMKDLHKITSDVANATPTTVYEELGKNLAEEINTHIGRYFSYDAGVVSSMKTYSNVKDAMNGASIWNSDWNDVIAAKFQDFPSSYGVPEGAAILAYTSSSNTFSYRTSGNSLLDRTKAAEATIYQYPAELMYYSNSALRTSDVSKKSDGYPNGVGNWNDNTKWTAKGDWSAVGSKVTSTTRATAMAQNVNYGVAILQTTVGIKEGVTSLVDNRNHFFPSEDNNNVTPNFTLKGVVIGGQPATVDWQFLPTTAETFSKVVYDNSVGGSSAGISVPTSPGAVSSSNYTIVLDNYKADPKNKVKVALEFVNNGDDFWGRENIIMKDQTFYLVAELDPTKDGLTAPEWDAYYQVPPLDANGASTRATRVFIQDHMTTANFKLNNTSLQGAYVSLPDLRSSQLSFGLSVDLVWKNGLTFDADLGGN
jgi:hypothetical protein